ncbi:MAG: SCP2 sterol-binding domain-containing protein, partial [Micromonosporaceae bacterium]|nr:SCP2 sterol-binding domain-containing protein [Micromonosporaceae bacterium]
MTAQTARPRADLIDEFFDRISATPQPLLHGVAATVRFELTEERGDERVRLVRIRDGRVHVGRRPTRADATIRTDRRFFEYVVTGEANALTAALRGRLHVDGDIRLLVAFSRLLPSPPRRVTTVPPPDRAAKQAAQAAKAAGTTARTGKVSAGGGGAAGRGGAGGGAGGAPR